MFEREKKAAGGGSRERKMKSRWKEKSRNKGEEKD